MINREKNTNKKKSPRWWSKPPTQSTKKTRLCFWENYTQLNSIHPTQLHTITHYSILNCYTLLHLIHSFLFPSVLFCSVLLIHATHRHTLSMRLQYIKWITSYTTSHHIPLLKNESYHTPPLSHTTRLLLKMIHCLSICQHFTTSESNKPILIIILKKYFIVISQSKIKWKRKWSGNEVRITRHGITEGKIDREKKKTRRRVLDDDQNLLLNRQKKRDFVSERILLNPIQFIQLNYTRLLTILFSIVLHYSIQFNQFCFIRPWHSHCSVLFFYLTHKILYFFVCTYSSDVSSFPIIGPLYPLIGSSRIIIFLCLLLHSSNTSIFPYFSCPLWFLCDSFHVHPFISFLSVT